MEDLTKDLILGRDDLPRERVEVPEWNGAVYVRTLTGAERDSFEQKINAQQQDGKVDISGLKVRLVILTCCDAEGAALFGRTDAEAKTLNDKSSKALDRIFQAAQRVNGLSNEDIEELAGNSAGDQSDDSGSN